MRDYYLSHIELYGVQTKSEVRSLSAELNYGVPYGVLRNYYICEWQEKCRPCWFWLAQCRIWLMQEQPSIKTSTTG